MDVGELLEIEETHHADVAVFVLVGQLDRLTGAAFVARVERALARGAKHVGVDVRDVAFVDAAGVRALVQAKHAAAHACAAFALGLLNDGVRRAIVLAGWETELGLAGGGRSAAASRGA